MNVNTNWMVKNVISFLSYPGSNQFLILRWKKGDKMLFWQISNFKMRKKNKIHFWHVVLKVVITLIWMARWCILQKKEKKKSENKSSNSQFCQLACCLVWAAHFFSSCSRKFFFLVENLHVHDMAWHQSQCICGELYLTV